MVDLEQVIKIASENTGIPIKQIENSLNPYLLQSSEIFRELRYLGKIKKYNWRLSK
ncbi:hypothetical protein [Caproiciproducens sp.]